MLRGDENGIEEESGEEEDVHLDMVSVSAKSMIGLTYKHIIWTRFLLFMYIIHMLLFSLNIR